MKLAFDPAGVVSVLTATVVVDAIFMLLIYAKRLPSRVAVGWYQRFGLGAMLLDVFSIAMGVLAAVALAASTSVEPAWRLPLTAAAVLGIQLTHDVLFYAVFHNAPRGASYILDYFETYAQELGPNILMADASMVLCSLFLAEALAYVSDPAIRSVLLLLVTYLGVFVLYSRAPEGAPRDPSLLPPEDGASATAGAARDASRDARALAARRRARFEGPLDYAIGVHRGGVVG
jgi:hypothetical protein